MVWVNPPNRLNYTVINPVRNVHSRNLFEFDASRLQMFNRPRLLRSRKFRVPIPNDQGFTSQDHMSKPAAVRVLCAGDSSSCAEACIAVNSTSIPTTVILSEAKPQRSPKAIRGEARLSMSGHSRKWTCTAITRDGCLPGKPFRICKCLEFGGWNFPSRLSFRNTMFARVAGAPPRATFGFAWEP
jgi:hypothetical protein